MRCYLVRHAQTAWNGQNRLQGRSDIPLSVLGEQQAQRVAGAFATRRLDGLFTSALQRSRQTAHAIAGANQQCPAPHVEPSLAEIHLGAWEGLTPDEIDARFDGAYQRWRRYPSTVEIPGGELLAAFRQRVRETFERLTGTFQQDGEYVIVSHGGVIAALLAEVLEAEYDILLRRLCLDNAGITALECGFGKPHVLWVNSTLHLDGLLLPPSQAAIAIPSAVTR